MFDYSAKAVPLQRVLDGVQSNQVLMMGMAGAEPQEFLAHLHTIAGRVQDVTLTNCLPTASCELLSDPQYLQKAFKVECVFYNAALRRLHGKGRVSPIPFNLHQVAQKRIEAVHTDLYVASATLPDDDGYFTLSCASCYDLEVAKAAGRVVLEVSPNVPRIPGDNKLHYSEVDAIVEVDYAPPLMPDVAPNERDREIGAFIADMIHDGDCVQIGIGGIPNALCESLMGKKDLGVHSEMMTTGVMRLMQAGVVNNSRKQVLPGKTVFCFALGTRELYDFVNENPALAMNRASWVNDPWVIAQNHNQVSINTTMEVDLTGQCCSEGIGHVPFSGTGGQYDTATGAQKSAGGRSIIALYSTAFAKTAEGGREEVSKIVPFLKPGAPVSLTRNEVDYVVTEYGVARLKGKSIAQRAEALIAIAHPKFRDELHGAARLYQYTS